MGKPTDVYHTALLLLAVLRREVFPFTQHDILAGLPQRLAERTASPFGPALANALHPHVHYRTQSPIEFWRELQAALTSPTSTGTTGPHPIVAAPSGPLLTGMPGSPGSAPHGVPGSAPQGVPGSAPHGVPGSAPQGVPGNAPDSGSERPRRTQKGTMIIGTVPKPGEPDSGGGT